MAIHREPVSVTYVSAVPGNVRHGWPCLDETSVRASQVVRELGLLDGMPFTWISIVITLGDRSSEPRVRRVNSRYRDLPVSIQVPMESLRRATRDETCRVMAHATSACILAVAERYGTSSSLVKERLSDLGGESV